MLLRSIMNIQEMIFGRHTNLTDQDWVDLNVIDYPVYYMLAWDAYHAGKKYDTIKTFFKIIEGKLIRFEEEYNRFLSDLVYRTSGFICSCMEPQGRWVCKNVDSIPHFKKFE